MCTSQEIMFIDDDASQDINELPPYGYFRLFGHLHRCSDGADTLPKDWNPKSYLIAYTIFCYILPLPLICYSYWSIAAVAAHEKAMREEAKKMNVKSQVVAVLRRCQKEHRNQAGKIALVSISLWFLAWTPYGILNFMEFFESDALTPTISIFQ